MPFYLKLNSLNSERNFETIGLETMARFFIHFYMYFLHIHNHATRLFGHLQAGNFLEQPTKKSTNACTHFTDGSGLRKSCDRLLSLDTWSGSGEQKTRGMTFQRLIAFLRFNRRAKSNTAQHSSLYSQILSTLRVALEMAAHFYPGRDKLSCS